MPAVSLQSCVSHRGPHHHIPLQNRMTQAPQRLSVPVCKVGVANIRCLRGYMGTAWSSLMQVKPRGLTSTRCSADGIYQYLSLTHWVMGTGGKATLSLAVSFSPVLLCILHILVLVLRNEEP